MKTALALLAITLAVTGTGSAQQPTFRAGARIVPIYATVTDAAGRLVPGLLREDFEILDNGKPQPLEIFDSEIRPITVVTMLDTSLSMTGSLDLLTAGAEQFLLRLLPADRGWVGSFNDKIKFGRTGFTSDRDALIATLDDLDFGQPTRLYDAIDESLTKLADVDGRKVILVFTDGDDTFSRIGQRRVLERARDMEVMVYAIGLRSEYFDGMRHVRSRPDRGLRRLADETGGGYFELEKKDELGPTFTRVAQELHSQYVLGFTPSALDGKVHKVDVRVKQPGMSARARRTYTASAQ